jgi:alcohol dehydrogenase class IV
MEFTYQSFGNKVYFGENYLQKLPEIVQQMGGKNLFVILRNSPQIKSIAQSLLSVYNESQITFFYGIVQHVPKTIVEKSLKVAEQKNCDLIIAIGGGSAIGLAKGMALETGLPILAIPTTYAGSEMTNVYGISTEGVKSVGKDIYVLPRIVMYVPSLTAGMPLTLAATSAMNAMAHLVEALYAVDINPVVYQIALMGMRSLRQGMELLIEEKSLQNANQHLQFGAYLAGKCLCEVSMALHHKLAHTLGGSFGMEHGKVHTVLLPYVLSFQYPALSTSIKKDLEDALDSKEPALKLKTLAKEMGAETTLKDIGFQELNIPIATQKIIELKKFPNPVALTAANVHDLMVRCYFGQL